jgi:hypothetical protein
LSWPAISEAAWRLIRKLRVWFLRGHRLPSRLDPDRATEFTVMLEHLRKHDGTH